MPYTQALRGAPRAGCCFCTQASFSIGKPFQRSACARSFEGNGGVSLFKSSARFLNFPTKFSGKRNPFSLCASLAEDEFVENEGDYALPSLDFDDLTGGRASKERAKKLKQEEADAKLLEAWDSSQMAKESTYDMLGVQERGARDFGSWKPVDPAEYLAKVGIYDQKRTQAEVSKLEDIKLPPGWELDLEEEEPFIDKKKRRGGQERDLGKKQSANAALRQASSRGVKSTGSRKAEGAAKAAKIGSQLKARQKKEQSVAAEDVQRGFLEGSEKYKWQSQTEALQEEWSLNSWDLGLPDEKLVQEFLKQAPSKKVPRSDSFGREEGPSFAAEFKNLEGGEDDLDMPLEELEATARAIEERLGLRGNAGPVSASKQKLDLEPGLRRGKASASGESKAPATDDDTLLAQFDQIMGGQLLQPDKQATAPPSVDNEKGRAAQKQQERWLVEEDDEESEEDDEDLQRVEDLMKGRKVPGLVPQARARLAAEKKFEDSDGEDSDTDEEEEIEEQFIQDDDWQDGWGDDMYLDIDEEIEKKKKERASKRAKKGARSIVDLSRSNKSLVGRLNQDGTVSIKEGSQEGRENGRPVRGIEDLSRGSRKRVDVEKEKRESNDFIQGLYEKAERTKKGKKMAKRDRGSTWETPEMLAEREKELAHHALEEELQEEEKMLEARHERVQEQFNLIDRLVQGDEDYEEDVVTSSEALAEEIDSTLLSEFDSDFEALESDTQPETSVNLESQSQVQEAEQKRIVDESLAMGGLWADLDDEDLSPSRSVGADAFSGSASTSKEADTTFGDTTVQERTVLDKQKIDADKPVASTSGRDGEISNGRRKEENLPVEREGNLRTGVKSEEPSFEQLKPTRMRREMQGKSGRESPEMVISGYPELELEEEVDPLTGEVRQVVRHAGATPYQVQEEERRDSARLAQSLTAERDEAAEANLLVDRLLNAGEQVEEMIEQLGREKRLDGNILRAIDRKIGVAKKNKEDQVCETLDILHRYIEAEMERQNASPALRLLDELLQLDDGTLDEATWLRTCRDRMREEFVPEGRIDIFNPPGVPKPRPDGTWEYPEQEGILRIDFVREVDDLLRDLEDQQREFTQASGFTAEAIAARLVVEQKMRTAAQLRKLKRNAAMLQI